MFTLILSSAMVLLKNHAVPISYKIKIKQGYDNMTLFMKKQQLQQKNLGCLELIRNQGQLFLTTKAKM